ncbi:hypothetical protein ABPG72_016689 [Tetrahymena utriculariae]
MINSGGSTFQLKVQTSQNNITQKQIQTNYRNQYVYLNEFIISDFKTYRQITQVKQGSLIQEETTFSSPIQYLMTTQQFDRKNQIQKLNNTSLLQVFVEMNEVVQFFLYFLSKISSSISCLQQRNCFIYVQRSFRQKYFLIIDKIRYLKNKQTPKTR